MKANVGDRIRVSERARKTYPGWAGKEGKLVRTEPGTCWIAFDHFPEDFPPVWFANHHLEVLTWVGVTSD